MLSVFMWTSCSPVMSDELAFFKWTGNICVSRRFTDDMFDLISLTSLPFFSVIEPFISSI